LKKWFCRIRFILSGNPALAIPFPCGNSIQTVVKAADALGFKVENSLIALMLQ